MAKGDAAEDDAGASPKPLVTAEEADAVAPPKLNPPLAVDDAPPPKLNPPVAGAEPSDRPNPPTAAVEAAAAGAALLFSSSSSASCALEYPAFALAKNAAENPPVAAGLGFSSFSSFSSFVSSFVSSSSRGFFSALPGTLVGGVCPGEPSTAGDTGTSASGGRTHAAS